MRDRRLLVARGGSGREGLPLEAGVAVDPAGLDARWELRDEGGPVDADFTALGFHPDGRVGFLLIEAVDPGRGTLTLRELPADAGQGDLAQLRERGLGEGVDPGVPGLPDVAVEVLGADGQWVRVVPAFAGASGGQPGLGVRRRAELPDAPGRPPLVAEVSGRRRRDLPHLVPIELELANPSERPAEVRALAVRVLDSERSWGHLAVAGVEAVPVERGPEGVSARLFEAGLSGSPVVLAPGEVRRWRLLLGSEGLAGPAWRNAREWLRRPSLLVPEPRGAAATGWYGSVCGSTWTLRPDAAHTGQAIARLARGPGGSGAEAHPPMSELALRFAQGGDGRAVDTLRDDAGWAQGAPSTGSPPWGASLWVHLVSGWEPDRRRALSALSAAAHDAGAAPWDARRLGAGLTALSWRDAIEPGGDALVRAADLVAGAVDAAVRAREHLWLGVLRPTQGDFAGERVVYPVHLAAVVFGLDAFLRREPGRGSEAASGLLRALCRTLAGPCRSFSRPHPVYLAALDRPELVRDTGPRGAVEAVGGALVLGWERTTGSEGEHWLDLSRRHASSLGHELNFSDAGAAWPWWQPFCAARARGWKRASGESSG